MIFLWAVLCGKEPRSLQASLTLSSLSESVTQTTVTVSMLVTVTVVAAGHYPSPDQLGYRQLE